MFRNHFLSLGMPSKFKCVLSLLRILKNLWLERNVCLVQSARMMLVRVAVVRFAVSLL